MLYFFAETKKGGIIMAKLSLLEQETIFIMNEKEKTATIFTYNRAYPKKLQELCRCYPDKVIFQKENGDGTVTYTLPKKWLKIIPQRQVSEKRIQTLEAMRKRKK